MAEGLGDAANAIQGALRAIRPVGAWFLLLTLFCALSMWLWHDVPFETWPVPVRCALWSWLIASTSAVVYLHVVSWSVGRASAALQAAPPQLTHGPSAPPGDAEGERADPLASSATPTTTPGA